MTITDAESPWDPFGMLFSGDPLRIPHLVTWPGKKGGTTQEGAVPVLRHPLVLAALGRKVDDGNNKGDGEDGDGPAKGGDGDGGCFHRPVMVEEVVHFLEPRAGKLILDGTLGGGGHAERMLAAGAHVLGIDQDADAVAFAKRRLSPFADRLAVVQSNFRFFPEILEGAGVAGVDGILVDLGVSSHQLDDPERGFSFQSDGPLDMRMDERGEVTAADLVNGLEVAQLADIFFRYGDERMSRRIAREIVARRERRKFETTRQLAALIERLKPRRGRAHQATKVFQALRIAVNDEIKALEDFLEASTRWIRPGGALVVITFHSLEDRVVKHFIKERCNEWTDRPEWPEPRKNPLYCFAPVTGKPVPPSEDEMKRNPRARSAKLRVAKRIGTDPAEGKGGAQK